MTGPAPDPDGLLARVLRAHASVVDPWLRAAAASGADAGSGSSSSNVGGWSS